MLGATKIIGIDKNEMKKEKGEAFGMTDFINPTESDKPISELVKELSGGMGVDYSFECTGVSPLLTQAVESTKVVTFSISIQQVLLNGFSSPKMQFVSVWSFED